MLLLLLPAKTGTSSQLKLKWSLMQWCILNRLEFLIIPTASTHQQWERVTICSKRVTTVYVRRGLIWSPLHPLNCTRRRESFQSRRQPGVVGVHGLPRTGGKGFVGGGPPRPILTRSSAARPSRARSCAELGGGGGPRRRKRSPTRAPEPGGTGRATSQRTSFKRNAEQ
jgi:hypothetical protein